MSDLLRIDNSKRLSYRECPRKYYLRYVKHLVNDQGSSPLRYGSIIHAMLEGFHRIIKEQGWGAREQAKNTGIKYGEIVWDIESNGMVFNEDYRTLDIAKEVFLLYLNEYTSDSENIEVLETEQHIEFSVGDKFLKNTFIFEGIIDLIIKLNGKLSIVDHKSTGSYLAQASKQHTRSPQLMGYSWLYYLNTGKVPTYYIVDLLHTSARRSPKTGLYGKTKIEFARIPQILEEKSDFENLKQSIFNTVILIQRSHEENYFYPELSACNNIFGRCQFFDICSNIGSKDICDIDPMKYGNYTIKEWKPSERVDILKNIKIKG